MGGASIIGTQSGRRQAIILQLSELGNMDHLEPEKKSKMPLKQQDQS